MQAVNTAILVDSCTFRGCYASTKGGALLEENGNISVVNSTFHHNVVGNGFLPGIKLMTQRIIFYIVGVSVMKYDAN